jgi:hypothetical protein
MFQTGKAWVKLARLFPETSFSSYASRPAWVGLHIISRLARLSIRISLPPRDQFLILPLVAKFDPHCELWPLRVKLSPRCEDPLFASFFFDVKRRLCSSLGMGSNLTPRVKLHPSGQTRVVKTGFSCCVVRSLRKNTLYVPTSAHRLILKILTHLAGV